MNSEWLVAENHERTYELLTAINALSIHAKLLLTGVNDSDRAEQMNRARATLSEFLNRFDKIVTEAEHAENGMIIGVDPRLSQLARTFLSNRKQLPQRSVLYEIPISRLCALLGSEDYKELDSLINCLREFRILVEQNAHADIETLLGKI